MFLEMRGSLESLFADAADVAAVLAVSLFAVPPQRVGGFAQLIAVETLVPVIHVQLLVFPTFFPISRIKISIVGRSVRGLGMMADQ